MTTWNPPCSEPSGYDPRSSDPAPDGCRPPPIGGDPGRHPDPDLTVFVEI